MSRLARAMFLLLALVGVAGIFPTTSPDTLRPILGQSAGAQESCADFAHDLPVGATLVVLACLDGVKFSPEFIGLEQVRIPVGESVPVRETFGDLLLYVETGEVVVFDPESGRELTVSQGSQHFLRPPGDRNYDEVKYGLRNDGVEEMTLLRLSFGRGPAAEGLIIDFPQLGTAESERLFRVGISQVKEEVDRVFLARVTLEPGADLDYHSHPGTVVTAVESGILGVEPRFPETLVPDWLIERVGPPLPSKEATTLAAGQFAVFPEQVPHREWNDGETPLSYLLAGIVRAADPLVGDNSTLEIHSAICPPRYTGGNHYRDCHDWGRDLIPLILLGDSGYRAEDLTVGSGEGRGPGRALFYRLSPGQYHLSEETAGSHDEAVIYCSGNEGESALAQRAGPATAGIDLDVPAASYIVCDWYVIPAG